MITRLQVRNFKSLRELEVEFGRLTVIVGPNGCGKSSVLGAIKLLRDQALEAMGWISAPPFPAEAPSRAVGPAKEVSPVAIRVEFDGSGEMTLAGEFVASAKSGSGLAREGRSIRYNGVTELPTDLASRLAYVDLYQLDKNVLEQPAHSQEASPSLGLRGEELGAVLDAMQGERLEEFQAIQAALIKFVPELDRLRLRRVQLVRGGIPVIGHQVVLDFEFATAVPADLASEGTILLLGLLTVIGAEPGPPKTILLDDLDRGLHPKAQERLVKHLHELLDSRPDLQIIATTHSPYLVEHLEYDEVLAMTQSPEDGRSLIAPLAEHPDAERWREEMSPGEFWSSVGESWIREAKP